jgi:AraC-like DNA-binding protein
MNKIIHDAKNMLFNMDKTVSEIAGKKDFRFAQHFSRMVINETGYTPNEL